MLIWWSRFYSPFSERLSHFLWEIQDFLSQSKKENVIKWSKNLHQKSCYLAPPNKRLLEIQCVIINNRNPLKANLREKQVSNLCNQRSILGRNELFICRYMWWDLFWDNRFVCEVQIMCDAISHGIWVLKLSVRKDLVTDALFVWGWCVCVGGCVWVCVCVCGGGLSSLSHFCKESQVESSCKFSWINENKSVLWITYLYKTSLEKLLGAQGGTQIFFFFYGYTTVNFDYHPIAKPQTKPNLQPMYANQILRFTLWSINVHTNLTVFL